MTGKNHKINSKCRISSPESFHVEYMTGENENYDITEVVNLTHVDERPTEETEISSAWTLQTDQQHPLHAELLVSVDEIQGFAIHQLVSAETCLQLADMFHRAAFAIVANHRKNTEQVSYQELMDEITERKPAVSFEERQNLVHHNLEVESKIS